mmetsp:Transcript_28075/g.68256  ORF Transcript_28075/g.68256 Transcript_28075/m.68256 type:complete len:214 (-) Transcript_28075:427-1068(-)
MCSWNMRSLCSTLASMRTRPYDDSPPVYGLLIFFVARNCLRTRARVSNGGYSMQRPRTKALVGSPRCRDDSKLRSSATDNFPMLATTLIMGMEALGSVVRDFTHFCLSRHFASCWIFVVWTCCISFGTMSVSQITISTSDDGVHSPVAKLPYTSALAVGQSPRRVLRRASMTARHTGRLWEEMNFISSVSSLISVLSLLNRETSSPQLLIMLK